MTNIEIGLVVEADIPATDLPVEVIETTSKGGPVPAINEAKERSDANNSIVEVRSSDGTLQSTYQDGVCTYNKT